MLVLPFGVLGSLGISAAFLPLGFAREGFPGWALQTTQTSQDGTYLMVPIDEAAMGQPIQPQITQYKS